MSSPSDYPALCHLNQILNLHPALLDESLYVANLEAHGAAEADARQRGTAPRLPRDAMRDMVAHPCFAQAQPRRYFLHG
jgi:hypothetical protein